MSLGDSGKPALIRVDSEDPLVLSCARCGWTPERPDPQDDLLPWSVIEHLLVEHWDGVEDCAPDEKAAGSLLDA